MDIEFWLVNNGDSVDPHYFMPGSSLWVECFTPKAIDPNQTRIRFERLIAGSSWVRIY